ncbi:MAG: class III extradiol ring-cleavage dioxygenase, partial [Pseudomonadota bacterium]
ETIHDFHGFPEELYSLRYPAPGAPDLAGRAVELLSAAGFSAATDATRGLDHGAWIPLMLAYPNADVPVAQLSIQPDLGPAHHLAMGRALAPLRREGALVLGSGGAVHNLSELNWGRHGDPPAWARAFDNWLAATLAAGDSAQLADWRARAPNAAQAHPRDEHFLPLLVAFGAAGIGARGTRLHTGFAHGTLSMAAFRFE